MIQLAWRFLMFQKDSALAHWFYARTKNAPQTRKTMIVALARKLLIALWRLVRVRRKVGATANLDSSCARRLRNTAGRGEETGLQVEQRNRSRKKDAPL